MTNKYLGLIMAYLLSATLFAYQELDDNSDEETIDIEESPTLLNLPDDILYYIIIIIGDIKSNSLPREERSKYRIIRNNFYQTFNKQSIVSILPLVNHKFNNLIGKLRDDKIIFYRMPALNIPNDPHKIAKIKGYISYSLVGMSLISACTAAGFSLDHLFSFIAKSSAPSIGLSLSTCALTIGGILNNLGKMPSNELMSFYAMASVGSLLSSILLVCNDLGLNQLSPTTGHFVTVATAGLMIIIPGCCCLAKNKRS